MNHTSELRQFPASPAHLRSGLGWKGIFLAVPALLALGGTGCFRASGFQRTTVVAEAIPELAGDRVLGSKSMAGPGDYYLGNDFLQVAIDGTRFGDTSQSPIAGAVAGGSIVDAGYLNLDTSYQRVSIPGDSLERLTPVVNQDPSLELVFDSFVADSTHDPSTLTMTGHLLDRNNSIYTITKDLTTGLPVIGKAANHETTGLVQGVTVTHVLSLGKLDRFLTLSTTITNESGTALGIRTIGDFLSQTSGGYRFAVPAGLDAAGNPLAKNWGIQIPGSDWGSPIATGVQAPFVVLMATEPGDDTVDSHASLGIMSVDEPRCLVTSDPQDLFGETSNTFWGDRPVFPNKMVVGSLPLPPAGGVAAGSSIAYNRRLYILGASSASGSNQSAGLYNMMSGDRYNSSNGLWPQDYGFMSFSLTGTATKQGPLPTEVRIERNFGVSGGAPVWVPERAEWFEPGENVTSSSYLQSASEAALLLAGTYRLVITNKEGVLIKDQAVNQASPFRPLLSGSIKIDPSQFFSIGGTDYLCPEVNELTSQAGTIVRNLYSVHSFLSRERNAPVGSLQPLRITIKGTNGAADPWMKRSRTIGTVFSAITKTVAVASSPGKRQFRAGNEMFGTSFDGGLQTGYFLLPNGTSTGQLTENGNPVINGGSYVAYGTRGPLSTLQTIDLLAYDGQTDTAHSFLIWPQALPTGWTTFDVPGPGQNTTGGLLTGEKLTSAMAEGVEVVGHTEQDLATDGDGIYNAFTWEFVASGFTPAYLTAVSPNTAAVDPFVVGGRTSVLPEYGTVTALFTPAATRYRFGGAIQPNNWTLADFLTQAQGQYNVVHQPRGTTGLFTLKGVPVIADASSWWNDKSGVYANGMTNGGFDAIELLRGEGFDKTNPGPWFQQFLQVRQDWFALLNQQTPDKFTKALGLSSSKYSLDTPVGLARTYLKAAPTTTSGLTYNANGTMIAPTVDEPPRAQDLSTVLASLKSGALVASTGPFLDVTVGTTGPGGLVAGPLTTATVNVNLYRTDWMPLDEVRVIMNGSKVATLVPAQLVQSSSDTRLYTATVPVTLPTSTGAWIVVEAGVNLDNPTPITPGSPWYEIMRGIYPIAVTNPIFIDATGRGYTHP